MPELTFFENIYTNHPTVISTSLAAIVAFFVAVTGITKQRQTSQEKNSLDFEANYKDNKDIRDAWILLRVAVAKDSTYLAKLFKERDKDNKADEETRSSIILILNEWERAANAIEHGLFNDKFLYQAYGTIVIQLFQDLSPFIKSCQEVNPRIFIKFTRLSIRWQIERGREVKGATFVKLQPLHKLSKEFDNEYKKGTR